MNGYTVVWHDDAQNQLAQIWMSATDRQDFVVRNETVRMALRGWADENVLEAVCVL